MMKLITIPTLITKLIVLSILMLAGCSSGGNNSGRYLEDDATSTQKQYLIDNAKRSGVVTTPSGLQYEVLTGASGPSPGPESVVTVHYIGTLIDGTEFDSSYSRNEPATFPLGNTIKGWVEGVQLMTVGSHYRFVIPAELAYGDRGTGNQIKPGDTLIFSIELLSMQ